MQRDTFSPLTLPQAVTDTRRKHPSSNALHMKEEGLLYGQGRLADWTISPSPYQRINEGDPIPPCSLSQSLLVCGRANETLDVLPEDSVRTVVTSPPYWSLRDYEVDQQTGRDDSLTDYVASLVRTFAKNPTYPHGRRHHMAERRRRLHVGQSRLSSP